MDQSNSAVVIALKLFGINLIHQTLKMSRERAAWQGIFDSSLSRNAIGALINFLFLCIKLSLLNQFKALQATVWAFS